MRTYRELFGAPEFTPLFLTSSVQVAATVVAGLALGTLVYAATHSPLLSALSMFGPSLAQMIGATALLSAADRLPPRAATTGVALVYGLGTAAQAIPGLPVWAIFAIAAALGTTASLGGGVRYGLLNEILPREGYLLGRSVLNMSVGIMQIGGFAVGGVLVATLSSRGALLAGAALYLVAAAIAQFGLGYRPPRTAGRPSITQTWRNNAQLWSYPPRRYVYLALWVPNGLIVGCESLFVPYAPRHAGLFFAFAALGMLVGDTLTGRFVPPRWQGRLGAPLRLLLAAPYLVFAFHPALPVAVAAVVLASVGYSASLLLQQRLMALTPDELSGHALGLHSSGMLTMQGVGAAIAGAVAQQTSPGTAMAVMAAASVAVTLALAPGLRPDGTPPQPEVLRRHSATDESALRCEPAMLKDEGLAHVAQAELVGVPAPAQVQRPAAGRGHVHVRGSWAVRQVHGGGARAAGERGLDGHRPGRDPRYPQDLVGPVLQRRCMQRVGRRPENGDDVARLAHYVRHGNVRRIESGPRPDRKWADGRLPGAAAGARRGDQRE